MDSQLTHKLVQLSAAAESVRFVSKQDHNLCDYYKKMTEMRLKELKKTIENIEKDLGLNKSINGDSNKNLKRYSRPATPKILVNEKIASIIKITKLTFHVEISETKTVIFNKKTMRPRNGVDSHYEITNLCGYEFK